jgi:hypothetical protein
MAVLITVSRASRKEPRNERSDEETVEKRGDLYRTHAASVNAASEEVGSDVAEVVKLRMNESLQFSFARN